MEVREEGINSFQRVRERRLLKEINFLGGIVSPKKPWDYQLLTEKKTLPDFRNACRLYTNTKYMASNVYLMSQ